MAAPVGPKGRVDASAFRHAADVPIALVLAPSTFRRNPRHSPASSPKVHSFKSNARSANRWAATAKLLPNAKNRPTGRLFSSAIRRAVRPSQSALTRFKTTLGLVDHVYTALAAHNAAVAVPVLERTERVFDFHSLYPHVAARRAPLGCGCFDLGQSGEFMVGDTGIEPVTPSMSTKCSTAELITHPTHSRPPNKRGRGKNRAGSGVYKRSRRGDQGLSAHIFLCLYFCDRRRNATSPVYS